MAELSVRDHHTLRLAFRLSRPMRGRVSILEETGYTEPRFWARVSWLLDQHAAHVAYPTEAARLVRLQERRRAARRGRVA